MTLEEWKTKIPPFEYNEVMYSAKNSWSDFREEYIEEHKKEPTKAIRTKFFEKYFKEHAMLRNQSVRQSKKENDQIEVLLTAFITRKQRLSVKDIEQLLIAKTGYGRGGSVKTIYRRILPELKEEYGIIKGDDNLYYYPPDPTEEEKRANRVKIYTFLIELLEERKDHPLYIEARRLVDRELALYS